MLIAEDLLLLLTDDDSGRLVKSAVEVDPALGGALLVELTLAGVVDLTDDGGMFQRGRLVVAEDGARVTDPELVAALGTVRGRQGRKPESVVPKLGKGVRKRLYARLTERGILRSDEGRILGIFPTSRWPTADAAHEEALRRELAAALRTGLPSRPEVGALVSLVHALRALPKVLDPEDVGTTRREMTAQAKRISEGEWASAAVRRAIAGTNAAVAAALAAATVTAGGS